MRIVEIDFFGDALELSGPSLPRKEKPMVLDMTEVKREKSDDELQGLHQLAIIEMQKSIEALQNDGIPIENALAHMDNAISCVASMVSFKPVAN